MNLSPLDPWIAGKIGANGPPLHRPDLEAYQLRKLRETLALCAARSRFYHKRLAGVPLDLTSLTDLSRIPTTSAEDIRAGALRFLCVSQGDIDRVVTLSSSGTTGAPKRLYFTQDDQDLTADFFRVGMSTFTEPGDHVLILLPGETPGSVGDLLAAGLARLGAVAIKHGPVLSITQTLRAMFEADIDVMVGIPVQVLSLLRSDEARSFPLPKLKSVLLTTDHVPAAVRHALEAAWGCQVYNHYGMTEMGLGGGVECEAQRGYHLREADLYVEIIDPATGVPVPDGEPGEIVFTTLTREGMPLIRYRTGDVGHFIPGPCPCGSHLKTLAHVTTRLDAIHDVGGGHTLTLAELDEVLYGVDGVQDFNATLDLTSSGPARLTVRAQIAASAETTVDVPIRRALRLIPAVAAGRVIPDLHVQTDPLFRTDGTAKRRMTVKRA